MKKAFLKKQVVLVLATLLALGCMFAFLSACSSDKKFYTLQEAYKKHYLTKEDLEKISESFSKYEVTDLEYQENVKKDYLGYYKKNFKEDAKRYPDATIDDIDICRYWGEYNGFVVVQMSGPKSQYAGLVETITVAGIEIEYSGPDLLVWKIDS